MAPTPEYLALVNAIRDEIKAWSSLQVAIEQGMGGPEAREKEEWMVGVIANYCKDEGSSLDQYDLQEYVETIIDNEFDTIIEDGSISLFSRRIVTFRQQQNWSAL